MYKKFVPIHVNATADDLAGNNGLGRYILLPGSDGRAQEISRHFKNLNVKEHSRGQHLYLGNIDCKGKSIAVATVASGMGCPSMEIILHELFHLGGKRFLRVGTAGSLQPSVKLGNFVNAYASVRDEHTTIDYVPVTIPAVASFECVSAILAAAKKLKLDKSLQTGTVHCKSSFYAREFGAGPKAAENKAYLKLLASCGVLASEMETAALFIQTQLYNHQLSQKGNGPKHRVLAGAILAVMSAAPDKFISSAQAKKTTAALISLAFETIRILFMSEKSY
jgi:uridine phosphorylase